MADVSVTYKGSTIGSLSDTGQLTLETAGTYCEGDIDITYVSPGGGGGGVIYQDANGYLVLDDEGGNYDIQPLSVTTNGTYTAPSHTAYTPVTVNVSGGGSAEADAVRFIDYDGTILYYYSAADFLELSAMPANPSHTGLTAQGWNWTLSDAQDFVDEWGYLDIGQLYVTTSGNTEIDIEMPTDCKRLDPYLSIAVNGEVEVDWGDSTTHTTITGNSINTEIRTQHIYSSTGNYTISISVISGEFRFYHSNNYTYTLMSTNTTTGNPNRCYANYITAVRLGNNVDINTYGFNCCTSMKYITITNAIEHMGSTGFMNCYNLKCLITPPNAYTTSTMQNCYNLNYYLLPKNPYDLTVGLSSAYSLKSFIASPRSGISKTLYTSTAGTPSLIPAMRRKIISDQKYKLIKNSEYDYSSIIEGLTSIPSYQFSLIEDLYEVTLPNTITSIDTYAFFNCLALEKIILPNNLTTLGNYTFYYCVSLKNITIPSTVTYIGNSCFAYCYCLSEITIPSNVETIGTSAFMMCQSLYKITINTSKITGLPNSVFSGCYSLKSITIPSTVTSIGSSCFSNCYSLTNFIIPSGVTSIGGTAFSGCYGMKEYHFKRTTPPTITNANVFNNIPSDCIIYVPYSADHSVLNAYKTATYWSTYASYMQEEPQ